MQRYKEQVARSIEQDKEYIRAVNTNTPPTLIGNEAKVDESIQDTLMDLANYAVMTLIEMDEAE